MLVVILSVDDGLKKYPAARLLQFHKGEIGGTHELYSTGALQNPTMLLNFNAKPAS